jgi:hypothetical protein
MLHSRMMRKIHWCQITDFGEFSFGYILMAWFLDRVPLLCPKIFLVPSRMDLMLWAHVVA